MNKNPYQPPRDGSSAEVADDNRSLDERLLAFRKARRTWSQGCWMIGGLCIVAGISSVSLRNLLADESSSILTIIDSVSVGLILLGIGTIVFGPISWFWLRRGT
ncbi:MAG: hypothetical protein P8K79_04880 [Mariniblastus sp.]|nr:hypothetical protein [Mariniblastus sp.]